MASADAERYQHVIRWLEQQYGKKESIPKFEATPQNLQILYEIATKNEKRNQQAQIIRNDLDQKTEYYSKEAQRIDTILEGVGFSERFYSQNEELSSILKSLAAIALQMNLMDAELSSMMISMSDLMNESTSISMQKNEEKKVGDDLQKKLLAAVNRINELQKIASDLQQNSQIQQATESRAKNVEYFESKSTEYESSLRQLKSDFENSGADPSIFHRSLVQMHENLQKIQSNIDSKLSSLKGFHELPADMTLARIRIEEARAQLNKLDSQLSSSINQFI